MGFFSDIVDSLFGGSDDSAQQEQIRANQLARGDILATIGQGREDVQRLIPQGQESQRAGFQAALDLLGQAIPQQAGAFTQGNVGAQQNLLTGQQQIQNAILGNPVDLGGFQPQNITPDFGFANQTLPTAGIPQTVNGLTGANIAQLLQGGVNPAQLGQLLGGGNQSPFFSEGAAPGGSGGSSGINIGDLLSTGGSIASVGNALFPGIAGSIFGTGIPNAAGFGLGTASGGLGGLSGLAGLAGPAAILAGGLALGNKITRDKPINMDQGRRIQSQLQQAVSPGGNVDAFIGGAIGPGHLRKLDIMASGGGISDQGFDLPALDAFQQAEFARIRPLIEAREAAILAEQRAPSVI